MLNLRMLYLQDSSFNYYFGNNMKNTLKHFKTAVQRHGPQ